MAIELGASRLLAPYFSSSQIVWTVIIGMIMIAMALGNVWGGRMADKNPSPSKLYGRLLLAAVWTALIPFVGKYVIAGVSLVVAIFVEKNFLVWASMASCVVLFVFPLMLLGTVTPSLVKYTVSDLEQNGKIVGELEALNTIGSIIGTFVPTFVTIPSVGTAATFLIFAGVLALLAILYFISAKKKRVVSAAALLLIAVLGTQTGAVSFAFASDGLVYEGESIYNYLQVQEDEERIWLSTNVLVGVQSIMRKEGGLTGMYYDYALAAPFLAGVPGKGGGEVLILGLGTGTYALQCLNYFDGMRVEGVEIDEKIVKLSKEYFELPKEVEVSVYDGRAYLAQAGSYDVIMVDAYQDITIPFQMSTVEFFTQVKEHLKEDGVMVVNMNMRTDTDGGMNDYLCDTIASVFPEVYTVVVRGGTNMELFASENPEMLRVLEEQLAAYSAEDTHDAELALMMSGVGQNLCEVTKGDYILTDDKAPVEVLGMKVIDELISEELAYYKDMIKNGNIGELIELVR
ncbi:MAG: fused MFS/spermidine synthase [Lachnospiraceae bacterium]|nr:fused MFS/spermidine synthase [Lachnospiraceae bacterium]